MNTHSQLTGSRSVIEESYSAQLFHQQTNNILHNPYNHELRQVAAIERGDSEDLKHILEEDFSSHYGPLSDDPVLQELFIGIVAVTISSRAAIRSGVHYEKAFTLSDCCIREMQKTKDVHEIRLLYETAQIKYAELVRAVRSHCENAPKTIVRNSNIEQCKDYISSHVRDKITVRELAEYLGMKPNSLSALFHKHENITLKQYILNEKLLLVQRMLIYSPNSYVQIANDLGFPSQSYMGEQFKKQTGLTLRQYRETYQKTDFVEEDDEKLLQAPKGRRGS